MQIKDIVKKVKQIEIRTRKKTEATLMGQYHSAFKGQGMTFSEVRPYQFGDEIRRIDWNKTARFREPFVKVMEEERELTMMLVVDISASMDYGTKNQLKREYVAEIAASLGFSAAGNNDKVGLILFADKVYKVIPPQKGRKHILSIISCTRSDQNAVIWGPRLYLSGQIYGFWKLAETVPQWEKIKMPAQKVKRN